MAERAKTPPPKSHSGNLPPNSLTPEQVRRTEEARLRAKALRAQHDAQLPSLSRQNSAAGQKRPHALISGAKDTPDNVRNAAIQAPQNDAPIRPAKKFEKNSYIEYDFSKMTDTKGGFLSEHDDPLAQRREDNEVDPLLGKPANMSIKEWERGILLKKLRAAKAGPFEPGISALAEKDKVCRECGGMEIDFQWSEVFECNVCNACKEKFPDKYSLLTKTEAREDYLLTNPELEDKDLLKRMEKPNPHKSHWSMMQLYLRYQVEEFAFSQQKWGSPEALDEEFEKREAARKTKKEAKFRNKLGELRKRTRVDAFERSLARRRGEAVTGGADVKFGDKIVRKGDRHEHEWSNAVQDPETGMSVRRCTECGMESEEVEL